MYISIFFRVRPNPEIYTPKRDDEHPHPFHIGSLPPRPPDPHYCWTFCQTHFQSQQATSHKMANNNTSFHKYVEYDRLGE